MLLKHVALLGIAAGALSGCGNLDGNSLFFGQQQTVGVTISGSAPEQGGELTLGYKDRNIAVIPVAVKKPDGTPEIVYSTTENDWRDGFSVLGQFEVKADSASPKVGLGKFFATGQAAQFLAEGFAASLGGETYARVRSGAAKETAEVEK
jgi:hypothetical protein